MARRVWLSSLAGLAGRPPNPAAREPQRTLQRSAAEAAHQQPMVERAAMKDPLHQVHLVFGGTTTGLRGV